MVCPVYEQNFEATEFLFGSGVFCIERRLTGLGGARNIIRIRTNTPGGGKPGFSMPPDVCDASLLIWPIRQFDAGL
jgi:hypothetical protein